jgi:hypothetical protein
MRTAFNSLHFLNELPLKKRKECRTVYGRKIKYVNFFVLKTTITMGGIYRAFHNVLCDYKHL